MATTNIADLSRRANLPAKQAGGGTVAEFFQQNKSSMAAVLPKHVSPDRMLKIALQAIRTTPALMECTTKSLMGAVIQCATMGLEPNTVLGHAYLVPFKNRKEGRTDVQVVIGYKGLVDLARRSGQIESIAAHAVYEADEFNVALGTEDSIRHAPELSGDRGKPIAFYAVAKLKGGGHAFEVMSRYEVDMVMRSTQSKGAYGPWKDHYVEMGRKTVIRRLSKYLPLSVEFATAAALDGMAEAGQPQGLDGVLDGSCTVATQDDAPPETSEPDQDPPNDEPKKQAGREPGADDDQGDAYNWDNDGAAGAFGDANGGSK